MKNCYTVKRANGAVFSRHETKEAAMNYLYMLEGTGAYLVSPSNAIVADAKHLPKRTQCKNANRKGLFARLFRR